MARRTAAPAADQIAFDFDALAAEVAAPAAPTFVMDYNNPTANFRLIAAMNEVASHAYTDDIAETEWQCVMGGEENADVSAIEEGFPVYSPTWEERVFGSIEFLMDVHGFDYTALVKRAEAHIARTDAEIAAIDY